MTFDWNARARIVQHHVGGRGFSLPNHIPGVFALDWRHVLYEADPDCAKAMAAESKDAHLRDCLVLPYALGAARGPATLHVTANPYASSILRPNPAFADYYAEVRYNVQYGKGTPLEQMQEDVYDVLYGDDLRVVREIPVELRALDDLAREGAVPAGAMPDLFSVDTQGTEADVLRGAAATIRANTLAIVGEVDFLPMYEGQGSLGDLLEFGRAGGFLFAGFTETHDISPHRSPVGQRARGFTAFGDALLLRDVQSLSAMCADPREFHIKAAKLAFLAASFGRVEYALLCVERADAVVPDADTRDAEWSAALRALGARNWYAFVRDLSSAARAMPDLFPPAERQDERDPGADGPTWRSVELQPPDRSAIRLRRWLSILERAIGGDARRVRELALRRPHVAATKALYYALFAIAERRRAAALARLGPGMALLAREFTSFEDVFGRYGFGTIAHVLRERRLSTLQYVWRHAKAL
jgi:FkbM family methyltransferase